MEWIVVVATIIAFGGIFYAMYEFTNNIESKV